MEGASSLPKRRHPARYSSGTGHGRSAPVPVLPSGPHGLGERSTAAFEPLDSRAQEEKDRWTITDRVATAGKPKAISPPKPTSIRRERRKAIRKARRKGVYLRTNQRGLEINKATVRNYLDAHSPPTRLSRVCPTTSSFDTMAT